MSSEDEITPFEADIGRRMVAQPRGRHLLPPELVVLAVEGARSPRYEAGMEHVVTCAECRTLLRQFQEMERTREGTRPVRVSWSSSPQGRWNTVSALIVVVGMLLIWAKFEFTASRTVASLQDVGGTIRLTAGERLVGLPDMEPAQKALVVAALQTKHISLPSVLDHLHPRGRNSLQVAAFPVTGPVFTVVASTQPEFTWKMPADAVACRVLIEDLIGSSQSLKSKPITENHWKPKKPLSPGQNYRWQIVALDRTGKEIARVPEQIGEARFKVLEKDRAEALERTRTHLGGSHLVMGVLYAQEGMLDASEHEFQALNQANTNSALVRNLLESVRAIRGEKLPGAGNQ